MTLAAGTPSGSTFDRMSLWMKGRYFWFLPAVLIGIGGWLVYPSFRQLVATGATYEHWSRFIVMSFLVGSAILLLITRGIGYILDILGDRLTYVNSLLDEKPASRPAGGVVSSR